MAAARIDLLVGDASRARDVLGWRLKMTFSQLVEMMVDCDMIAVERGEPFAMEGTLQALESAIID